MSNDYGYVLRKIAAAQAVLAFEKMEAKWHTDGRYLRAKETAENKLLDLWTLGDADEDDAPLPVHLG